MTAGPTKLDLIAAVRQLNPTAAERFLVRFTPRQLADYLAHLQTQDQRGARLQGWVIDRQPKRKAA